MRRQIKRGSLSRRFKRVNSNIPISKVEVNPFIEEIDNVFANISGSAFTRALFYLYGPLSMQYLGTEFVIVHSRVR